MQDALLYLSRHLFKTNTLKKSGCKYFTTFQNSCKIQTSQPHNICVHATH